MINKIAVINDLGESLDLTLKSPEQSGFFIKRVDGLTPVKADINFSQSLYVDGGYFNSARQSVRNIVFELGFYDAGDESVEELRLKSYRMFPVKREIVIYIETDTREVYTTGYVESNEVDIFSKSSSTVVSVLCPEVVFRDLNSTITLFSGVAPMFEFPFENTSLTLPTLIMGSIQNSTTKSIVYDGSEETGLIITMDFTGGVTNPNVFNNTSGQKMGLLSSRISSVVGSGITTGDKIVISTIRNDKYIKLYRGTFVYNIMSALSSDSSWIMLYPGDNLLVYTASSGASSILMSTEHTRLFGGV